MKKFEATVRYYGHETYIVEAETAEEAEIKARTLYGDGPHETGMVSDNEEVERVDVSELAATSV